MTLGLGPRLILGGFLLVVLGFMTLLLGLPILIVLVVSVYYLVTGAGLALPALLVMGGVGTWYWVAEARERRAVQA